MEKKNGVVFVRGELVYLRPPTDGDIPLFLKWFNDEEVRRYIKGTFPMMEAEEIEWLRELHKKKNEHIVFVIVEAKTNTAIGTIGLHRINWKDRRATTGTVIGEKDFWGRGYGSEAKMLLLNYAFNTLNLRKICSIVYGFNKRSQAYNRKCGYRAEGVFKSHVFKNGKYCDEVHMAMFKKDWLPIWKRFKKAGCV